MKPADEPRVRVYLGSDFTPSDNRIYLDVTEASLQDVITALTLLQHRRRQAELMAVAHEDVGNFKEAVRWRGELAALVPKRGSPQT